MGINHLTNKKILVTGATGRLGCAMVARLEELGAKPIPIFTKPYNSEPKRVNWNAKINPIQINCHKDLEELEIPEYVINFHWCVNRNLNFTEQLLFEIKNNIEDLVFIWEWLLNNKIKLFVNISSTKIYSYLNNSPVKLSSVPIPITPYGIAKLTSENYFRAYFIQNNVPVINCRLSSIASYGEHPNQLITQLYNSAFNNKKIKIYINNYNNILFIDEAIDLIICSLIKEYRPSYNIVGETVLNEKTVKLFEEIANRKLNAEYINLPHNKIDPIISSDRETLLDYWVRVTSHQNMIEKIITQYNYSEKK